MSGDTPESSDWTPESLRELAYRRFGAGPGDCDGSTADFDPEALDALTSAADEIERVHAYGLALSRHGFTVWGSSACGTGRPGGQTITTAVHPEVVEHLMQGLLRGEPMKACADLWEQVVPGTRRLDEEPGKSGRSGPDGRPL